MAINFEIIFDNGGGALLQTPDYCHSYDDAGQLAYDVYALTNGSDTRTWDGNQPENRREWQPSAEERRVTSAEIANHLSAGTTPDQGGHMQHDFWRELHRLETAKEQWVVYAETGHPLSHRCFVDLDEAKLAIEKAFPGDENDWDEQAMPGSSRNMWQWYKRGGEEPAVIAEILPQEGR